MREGGRRTFGRLLTISSTCSLIFRASSSRFASPALISSTALRTSTRSFSTAAFCSSRDAAMLSVETWSDLSSSDASSYLASSAF